MRPSVFIPLATALGLAGAALFAVQRGAPPRVVLDPAVVDLGVVSSRTSREVLVRNHGQATLQILAVSSSCGCTMAAVDRHTVPPGQAARLVVTFDAAAHGRGAGPARHAVYVRTNDPRMPEAELEVRAVVTGRR